MVGKVEFFVGVASFGTGGTGIPLKRGLGFGCQFWDSGRRQIALRTERTAVLLTQKEGEADYSALVISFAKRLWRQKALRGKRAHEGISSISSL